MLLLALSQLGLVAHPCRARLAELPNGLYPLRYLPYLLDNSARPARVILRGDSSLELSGQIPGWTSGHNRAVFGNTACDIIQQSPAAPAGTPEAVVIGTYGGNEVLRGYSDEVVIANVRDLIIQTRERWPDAKIVGIGIHPIRAVYAAQRACAINEAVRDSLAEIPNSCDVDPYPIFGKSCGEMADPEQLREGDLVHYRDEMAWKIRAAVKAQCGVEL